jgi:hypothetical protein
VRNPLSWDFLTEVPLRDQIWGPLAIAYVIFFALGLIVTVVINNRSRDIFPDHRLHRETLHKITYRAMWGWITGLAFFLFRLMGLNFLGWRLWEYVCVLGVFVSMGYTYWWLRVRYPARVERFVKEQRRRAYLRPGSAAATALSSSSTRGDAASRADRQKRLNRADPSNRPAQRRQQQKASAKK